MTLDYLSVPSQSYFELVVQVLLVRAQHSFRGVLGFLLLFLAVAMLQGCFGRTLMRVFGDPGQSELLVGLLLSAVGAAVVEIGVQGIHV